MELIVKREVLNATIEYLCRRPYLEVADLISALRASAPNVEKEVSENVKKTDG